MEEKVIDEKYNPIKEKKSKEKAAFPRPGRKIKRKAKPALRQKKPKHLKKHETPPPSASKKTGAGKQSPSKEGSPLIKELKLFNRWSSDVPVEDPGLRNYINLSPRILPRSAGAHRERFHKSNMHIVERLALDITVSGHSGKRHRLTSGKFTGQYYNAMKNVEKALSIIEERKKANPIGILVKAIENAALREEIISFQVGSIVAREAVVTAPQRRIDKTLRFIAHGAYKKSFNSKKKLAIALADEISAAADGSSQSFAIQEKERIEREAQGAR